MKEVILKTGMQGSFSQIINNVGKLILREFLNPYTKTQSSKNSPLATSLTFKYVCIWAWVRMCVCEYLCAHVYICECIYEHAQAYVCMHMYACICMLVYICIWVCMSMCLNLCMSVYVSVHKHVCICMNMFVHVCMQVHANVLICCSQPYLFFMF